MLIFTFDYILIVSFTLFGFSVLSLNLFHFMQIHVFMVAPCCSGYHHCTTSSNKVWTQALCRFKPCSQHVGDSRWWGSPTVAAAENKAKRLSSVNHTTKTIHYHLYRAHLDRNEKQAIGDKCVNKRVRLFIRQMIMSLRHVERKRILGRSSKDKS